MLQHTSSSLCSIGCASSGDKAQNITKHPRGGGGQMSELSVLAVVGRKVVVVVVVVVVVGYLIHLLHHMDTHSP